MRRFTLITLIVIAVALAVVAVWQLSLGTSVEDRLDRNVPVSPSP